MNKHIEAIFEGQELSDDFKAKVATIFEAALAEKALALQEDHDNNLAEARTSIIAEMEEMGNDYVTSIVVPELTEKVNDYLSYAVSEWNKANTVAIIDGAKVELAENFVSGFKGLFEQHNIVAPAASEVDHIAEADAKVVKASAKLDEALNDKIELQKEVNELKRAAIILSVCEDLTATQIEKIGKVSEFVEFVDSDAFVASITGLKESYFPAVDGGELSKTKINESEAGADDKLIVENEDAYYAELTRQLSSKD